MFGIHFAIVNNLLYSQYISYSGWLDDTSAKNKSLEPAHQCFRFRIKAIIRTFGMLWSYEQYLVLKYK